MSSALSRCGREPEPRPTPQRRSQPPAPPAGGHPPLRPGVAASPLPGGGEEPWPPAVSIRAGGSSSPSAFTLGGRGRLRSLVPLPSPPLTRLCPLGGDVAPARPRGTLGGRIAQPCQGGNPEPCSPRHRRPWGLAVPATAAALSFPAEPDTRAALSSCASGTLKGKGKGPFHSVESTSASSHSPQPGFRWCLLSGQVQDGDLG